MLPLRISASNPFCLSKPPLSRGQFRHPVAMSKICCFRAFGQALLSGWLTHPFCPSAPPLLRQFLHPAGMSPLSSYPQTSLCPSTCGCSAPCHIIQIQHHIMWSVQYRINSIHRILHYNMLFFPHSAVNLITHVAKVTLLSSIVIPALNRYIE